LVQVLRLDPQYSNAPKAREMLEKLNEEYPPSADEIMRFPELQSSFPDVFAEEEDIFAGDAYDLAPFGQPEPVNTADLFAQDEPSDELLETVEFEDVDNSFLTDDSIFADLDDSAFVGKDASVTAKTSSERTAELKRTLNALDTAELTDDELAALEEQVGRRRGRGRRLLLSLVGLILIVVLVGAILFIAFPGKETKDPGELKVISLDSEAAAAVQASTEAELRNNTVLGTQSAAVFAESELGAALFIKICGRADTSFPQLVTRGMDLAVQQVSAAQDSLNAVGITIEACETDEHDTLYRAVVSVSDAVRYHNGEIDWAAFQKLWKTT
jgi:hypothetical protein